MELQITSRHISVSDKMKEVITHKIKKIEHYFDKLGICRVTINGEKIRQEIKVSIRADGKTHTAEAHAENLGKALDEVAEKIERQLKRSHRNGKDRKKAVPLKESAVLSSSEDTDEYLSE